MIHVIIDGYNLIRQIPSLARQESTSLEQGREHLVRLLSEYKKIKRHKITVIFDGILNLSEFAPTYKEAGINVGFSPGCSADDVIKDMVAKESTQAIVVSSDHAILEFAESHGSGTITAPEFYDKLVQAQMMGAFGKTDTEKENERPRHKRWLTYKKGASKKLPKKERRNRQRLGKL